MKNIFLNLKRPNPAGRMVLAVCAIIGDPAGTHGTSRTLNDVEEVATALKAAGNHDHRYVMALGAVDADHGAFFEITEMEAMNLRVSTVSTDDSVAVARLVTYTLQAAMHQAETLEKLVYLLDNPDPL